MKSRSCLRRFPVLAGALALAAGLFQACSSSRLPVSAPPASAAEANPSWIEEGVASWYGGNDGFEGKPTASGEIYDSSRLTAAHRQLPLGTVLDVTNVQNTRTVRVRINDRGPFIKGRIIDLSRAAAQQIGIVGTGTGTVRLALVARSAEREALSPTGKWSVQVGSFAEADRAERHADRVRSTGRTVYLEPFRGLSRVKIGPFDSRREAEDTLAKLEGQGFEGIVTPVH
ncbi:MAG: septal ring lytic transglycosylase RlpA family protein [Acidobacteria bacterium]|nr:septal ring lytic transglycosylase RlpA family protein [Acidobacteriota bacterium]